MILEVSTMGSDGKPKLHSVLEDTTSSGTAGEFGITVVPEDATVKDYGGGNIMYNGVCEFALFTKSERRYTAVADTSMGYTGSGGADALYAYDSKTDTFTRIR